MKKILILGPNLDMDGGISTVLRTIMSSRLSDEFNLEYFDTYSIKKRYKSQKSKININELLNSFRVASQFFLVLYKNNIDISYINVSSFWSFWEKSILILIARSLGVKVVVTVHGAEFDKFYLKSKCKYLMNEFLSLASVVTFVSKDMHNIYKQFSSNSNGIYLPNPVENPIELRSNSNLKEIVNEIKSIKDKYKTIFFTLSILEPRKRVVDIINAFLMSTQFHDSALIIAGSGSCENEIIRLCSKHFNIYFVHSVHDVDKKLIFDISDVFIQFSEKESFGLTIIESLLARKKIISTKVGVFSDSSDDLIPYFVSDEHDLINAISDSGGSLLEYNEAFKLADIYTKDTVVEEYIKLFKSC